MSSRRSRRHSWVVRARPASAVVLRRGNREVASWPLWPDRPDLGLVDELARLQLLVRRLGYSICVRDPCPRLTELLELAGLTDVVC